MASISLLIIVLLLLLLLVLAFEAWMFVGAYKNRYITESARMWWLLGMILIHPLIAIFYYLTDYQKDPWP